MNRNALAEETSPYLLQHKDNPVHWRVWGRAALEEAANANKPLLVSVGYAACHWCHVMAHESFEDEATAELMNTLYIPVKIDREERPDIDHWLQSALATKGGQGGWPLTAFLTPSGQPFWAGTYFPNTARHGLPDFKSVLRQIAALCTKDPAAITKSAYEITHTLAKTTQATSKGTIDDATLDRIAHLTAQRFDIFSGGLSGAPKFPNVANIELLWRAFLKTGLPQYRQLVLTTLDAMCRGGIYDHLGGGFARYSVDEDWLVPHFEKMLYDNAQLIDILTLVWARERGSLYARAVEQTITWLLWEMRVEGGFASSLDADSVDPVGHLHEGAFYIWREDEIDAAIPADAALFKKTYGVTRSGNFEGANILNLLSGVPSEADRTQLQPAMEKLLKLRSSRARPSRDGKVLVDWNGLAIAAIANAGLVFDRCDWCAAAKEAFAFIRTKMGAENDRLYHSYAAGRRQHWAFSDGYANMARASLVLWEIEGDPTYLIAAENWTAVLDRDFWDEAGGYRFAPPNDAPAGMPIRSAFDTATPAANGTMLQVLARLYTATGKEAYGVRANDLMAAFAGDLSRHYLQMTTFLNGFAILEHGLAIALVGPPRDQRVRDLARAAAEAGLPDRQILYMRESESLPPELPLAGKTMQGGVPTAYVCRYRSCEAPIVSAQALRYRLARLVHPVTIAN